MRSVQRDQLPAEMFRASRIPKCLMCGGKTAAVGVLMGLTANGQVRYQAYPACADCFHDANDPEIREATLHAIERRLLARDQAP